MPVVVLGLSHHTSPVIVREQFAFPEASIAPFLRGLVERGLASEAVVLSTCNRVELYASIPREDNGGMHELLKSVVEDRKFEGALSGEFYLLSEPKSLEHLFKVAAGLDSMVLGETEILGQLKKAYELALASRCTGPRLNKAFQKAFNVAKQIRTETNIQRGSVSVGSVAVELAEKIFSSLDHRQVMVIGAGDTSEKTARALLSRGAKSIIVANRSYERASALAAELGGRAVDFAHWTQEFEQVDIVISSTSAPHYVLDRVKLEPLMKARRNRSLLLIDIAVPRDIDPEVNFLDSVYLYNIDDLQAIADDGMRQRQEEITRCEEIVREKVKGLLQSTVPPGSSRQGGLAYET